MIPTHKLISEPTYEDPFNVNPATVGAIYDSESVNLSSVKTRGLDFGLGYKNTILGTGIDTGIDGGYIFAFDNQFSSVAPPRGIGEHAGPWQPCQVTWDN